MTLLQNNEPSRGRAPAIGPVVTIGWYSSAPSGRHYYKPTMPFPKGKPGWAVEILNDPAGGIGIVGFYRDVAVAWQEASRLALDNGWCAERDRRIALQVARWAVAEARP